MAYDRLSKYATVWSGNGSDTDPLTVQYHSTAIVRADASTVTLDSGGETGDWTGARHFRGSADGSVTTKKKMNQAANQFRLGYTVHQHKGDWYVTTKAGVFKWDEFAANNRFRFDRESGGPVSFLCDKPRGHRENTLAGFGVYRG